MLLTGTPPRRAAMVDSFCVHGFAFRLHTRLADARRLIGGLYRNFAAPNLDGPADEAVVEADGLGRFAWRLGTRAGANTSLAGALWNLEAALCEAVIRSQSRCIAIHAATLRAKNSLLLAGRSQSGKTTLSLALALRGFPLAGDDVALLEPATLNVLPIPRCFHLDERSAALLEACGFTLPEAWRRFRFFGPCDIPKASAVSEHARVLVFLRGPRAERPLLEACSQAEMTARLLSETGKGPLTDPETAATICRFAAGTSCFLLTPGPLAETAGLLAELPAGKSEEPECLSV